MLHYTSTMIGRILEKESQRRSHPIPVSKTVTNPPLHTVIIVTVH